MNTRKGEVNLPDTVERCSCGYDLWAAENEKLVEQNRIMREALENARGILGAEPKVTDENKIFIALGYIEEALMKVKGTKEQ